MSQNSRAVSPVIAVILMVAVTVVLSAAVGAFVFDIGQGLDENDSQTVGVKTTADGSTVTTQVITGKADELKLIVNGTVVDNETDITSGDTLRGSAMSESTVTVVAVTNGEHKIISTTNPVSGPVPPANGLITHWTFDTGAGSTAYDSVGGVNGNISGAKWTTNAKQGNYALDFQNNSNHYARNNTTGSINITQNVTMTAWVYVRGPGSNSYNRFVSYDDVSAATNNQIILFWDSNDNFYKFFITGSGTSAQATVGNDIPQDKWILLVGTYDGQTARLYVNGTEMANGTGELTFDKSNARFTVGHRSDTPNKDYIDGRVDDVRVYNRALSQSEVKSLYNMTK